MIALQAVALLLAGVRIGHSQSVALAGARLHASVEITPQGVFIYRYTVENGARSTAGVSSVAIDVVPPPATTSSVGRESVTLALKAPSPGWTPTFGADSTARWIATKDANFVLPKQTLGGFSISGRGLPSLRRYTLGPRIDAERAAIMPPGDDPGDTQRYQQDLEQYIASQSITGTTLAPAGSAAATGDALLANVISEVGQARSLGWIANDVVARNLRTKLEEARDAFARRQVDSATRVLEKLHIDVAAQSGKSLTSEAVGLVDMSVQYVLQTAAR